MRVIKLAWLWHSLLAITLTATCLSENHAQAVHGGISGTVTDSAGAVVAKVIVTIRHISRNMTDIVETNLSGSYVKDLLPGTYEVRFEKAGFKRAVVTSVIINVDTSTNLNVTLDIGQITETVTIFDADGELLKTDRADVATTFEHRQLTELPVLTRSFTRFILLTPGAEPLSRQTAASENPQGGIRMHVNGQSFAGIGYQLDGTDNRDAILGLIVINPSLESIGETKITSQNYDAEFGQAIAGIVSVQTKSGRNDTFGSVFAFRQNDLLQARNPFTQSQRDRITGKFLPDTLRNQFGASLGGHIIRNKLFFFLDYQGTRSKIGGSRLLTAPTLRARTGDLTEYGVNIFDPATTVTRGNILISRTQFSDGGILNKIPASRLSQQALNLLKLIPLPNAPGRDNGTRDNFVASGSEVFDNDAVATRIDGRLTQKLNVFGRYTLFNSSRNGPTAFSGGGGPELVSLGGMSKGRNHSLAIGFDYTLSNTSVVDVRFGYFRYKVDVLPFDYGGAPATEAGIPGLNLDDMLSSGLPGLLIQGDRGFGFGSSLGINQCNCPLKQQEDQFQGVGNVAKTFGNHTAKFGIDVRRAYNVRVPSDVHRSGELVFNADRTRGPSGGGLGLATLLLGDVTLFGRYVSTTSEAKERQWRHFYYGQDTWRATPKLTIAYGLRLDVINPQSVNKPGSGGFLDLNTGEIRVAGIGDNKLNGNVENSLNLGPRLGIAYQLGNQTVIRAGYGRSFDIGVFGSVFGQTVTQNLPVLSIQALFALANFERVFNLAQGPPAPIFPDVPANGRFRLPNGIFARAIPEKQRLPTVDAYNVTIQRQLTGTMSVEAGYVGNKGTHTFAGTSPSISVNQATLEGFGTLSLSQRRPFFSKFGWTQDIDYFCNCADNRYDSLQIKLTKRFSRGLSLLAHYTLSRTLDNSPEQFFFDRELNRGPSDYDRKHAFVLATLIELPFGRARHFLSNTSKTVDLLVGGWQFNSVTRTASGLPFNVTYNDAGIDRDTGPNRPDLIGDPQTGGSRDRYFNVTPIGSPESAFSRPARGTFGNLPRNALRGPNYWNTDASLFKKFYFTEKANLEFRIEVSNVFNHVNLGLPDATIGVPGNPNPNAGRINSLSGTSLDPNPMRNFQFGLKLAF
jgi:outer membrane receptor protein involved in Fe transport